jgi:hypothetical protein
VAVIVGAVIGTVSTLCVTLLLKRIEDSRRAKSVRAYAKAEITAIKEKAERYVDGNSSIEELSASTPIYSSAIEPELGYLSPEQVIAFRRTVTLDMEMRKKGEKEKALFTIQACEEALRLFSDHFPLSPG